MRTQKLSYEDLKKEIFQFLGLPGLVFRLSIDDPALRDFLRQRGITAESRDLARALAEAVNQSGSTEIMAGIFEQTPPEKKPRLEVKIFVRRGAPLTR